MGNNYASSKKIVNIIYRLFLEREAIEDSSKPFVTMLSKGVEIKKVINLVANSEESKIKKNVGFTKKIEIKPIISSAVVDSIIRFAYKNYLHRNPSTDDIKNWDSVLLNNIVDIGSFLEIIINSEESLIKNKNHLNNLDDIENRIYYAFSVIQKRCPAPDEFASWINHIRNKEYMFNDLLEILFNEYMNALELSNKDIKNISIGCRIMGTTKHITIDDWDKECRKIIKKS